MHQSINKKNRISVYLFFFLVLCTVNNNYSKDLNSFSTKVNTINVFGLSKNNNLEIKEKLSKLYLGSIFFIKKNDINNVILEYNLVDHFTVKKIYPRNINIDIQPTKFVAQIKTDKIYLVGANGKLINEKRENIKLPFLKGKFNQKQFLIFKKIINDSEFEFTEFESIFLHPSGRIDIMTKNNILMKLPKKQLNKALRIAYNVISQDQFVNIKTIDLRIDNQIIIQK
jgi:cell division protein FtsQ